MVKEEILKLPLSLQGQDVSEEEKVSLINHIQSLLEPIPGTSALLIQEKNPLSFLFSYHLALYKNLKVIALPNDMTEYQAQHLKDDIKGAWLLKNDELHKAQGETDIPEEVTHACLTSGTTGHPKLCFFNQEKSRLNARLHAESLGLTEKHTVIQTLPLYHSFGLVCYYYAWLETGFKLDLNPIFLGFKTLSKRKLDSAVLHISPSQLRFMLKEKTPPPTGIDVISIGGGSVDAESLNKINTKLPKTKIYVTYGLTEAGPRATTGLWNDQGEGFIGSSLSQVETAVLSEGQIQFTGTGKLVLKSPTLKMNLSQDEIKDGWLITRDHIELTEAGEIFFKGRENDLINFGGISLYPSDIETVVRSHPDVKDCIVLKIDSSTYEEEPLLVLEPALDPKEMRNFLKDKLAAGQIPRKIESLEKLPRTSLEKVDRKELKEILELS